MIIECERIIVTMYYLVCAVIISLVLYWVLQTKEDKECASKGQPPATTSKRAMLFFLLLIVATCLCYLINNSFSAKGMITGGDESSMEAIQLQPNYKVDMIKNIHEDVITGIPPFAPNA